MRKLIVSTQMTLDGVIDQSEQWFIQDGQHFRASADQLLAAEVLLLGRKTYQGLSKVWPTMTDDIGFANRINSMPKVVVSRTLQGPLEWNARLIEGDLAESVAALKRQATSNVVVYGCGELACHLVSAGLVDEVCFWVHPVVWGDGVRIFGGCEPVRLRLTSSTMFDSGVALMCYVPAG
jgi:dihydrofolate reductase